MVLVNDGTPMPNNIASTVTAIRSSSNVKPDEIHLFMVANSADLGAALQSGAD